MNTVVIGSEGFIARHLVRRLQSDGHDVRLFDLQFGNDARHLDEVIEAVDGRDIIFHLACNTTILSGSEEPQLDFTNGTILTYHVVEAARITGVPRIVYSSSGSSYGDQGETPLTEAIPLRPNSPYSAQKVASEALVESYCKTFGIKGLAFRFSNIVGSGQTHGVAYDFIRKLRDDPTTLEVLGNGTQRKSYLHVDDLVDAILMAVSACSDVDYDVFNLCADDLMFVFEIAQMVVDAMGLQNAKVTYEERRIGWPGDVPEVRLVNDKIRSLGWRPKYTSQEAMAASLLALVNEY